jgi:predicted outer membrane repeat protein
MRRPSFSPAVVLAAGSLLMGTQAFGATIHVPGDFAVIADAIVAASEGDSVLVDPGVYTGVGNRALDFGGKSITLLGIGGAAMTVIDCEQAARGFYFHSAESGTAVLSGFTIRNGAAAYGAGICCESASPTVVGCVIASNAATAGGGGMQCSASSPVIAGCEFTENTASSGGGLYCISGARPQVSDCVFKQNSALGYHGGAVFCYDSAAPSLVRCAFHSNTAERNGGGVYCENSSPSFTLCEFRENEANGSVTGFGGGAAYLTGSSPTFTDCGFYNNHAERGGGVNCRWSSAPLISSAVFRANTATAGGGVYCRELSSPRLEGVLLESGSAVSGGGLYADNATPRMTDCIFLSNTSTGTDLTHGGGGVHIFKSSGTIESCAFIDNSAVRGGAIHVRQAATASVAMTTIAGNAGEYGSAVYCRDSTVDAVRSILGFGEGEAVVCVGAASVNLTCCDAYGNSGGDWSGCIAGQQGVGGNISADPMFCGAGSVEEAYALYEASPCAVGNNPCGHMGKWGVGCGASSIERRSWGSIKATFK